MADPGFRTNDARGVGMVFGPDVTEVRVLREPGAARPEWVLEAAALLQLLLPPRTTVRPSPCRPSIPAPCLLKLSDRCFGPRTSPLLPCPQRFLTENGLRLVLRSHEGPDARDGRDDMQPMSGGYTLDHDTPAGKLMTVFRWVENRGGVREQ